MYWDGLVQLAFTLNDDELKAKAGKWARGVPAIQEEDGYLGNYRKNENRMEKYSGTAHNCGYRALLSWYDATGDEAVLKAVHRGLLWFVKNWADDRNKENYTGPILIDSMIAVYLETGDERLYRSCLDFMAWLDKHDKYRHGMASLQRPQLQYGENHCVAFGENVKNPALIYQANGRREYLDASRNGLKQIMSKAWQCTGGPSSNKEHHSPPSADHETEYCNFEAFLNTFRHMARITGRAEYGDFMERIVFNAAQGARRKNERAICYMTSPNQLLTTMNSTLYGCMSHYGVYAPCIDVACCPARSVVVYPMFVRAMCMRDAEENLFLPAYGPCRIRLTSATGAKIDIQEETDYPFNDTITLKIKASQAWKRTLNLKIPGWCKSYRVELNGKPVEGKPTDDGYLPVAHAWRDDTLTIRFEMKPRVVETEDVYFPNEPLRAVECGPLLFSIRVPVDWKDVPGRPITKLPEGWSWHEGRPRGGADALPSYSLDLAAIEKGAGIEKVFGKSDYVWEDSPLKLMVPMRRSPQAYELKSGKQVRVDKRNPVPCQGPAEMVELVPFGSTILRLTCFTICNKDESR
ncbi:MAG: glycoside hydrolase family 127 protein [Kiritimatiellaeota bacterium]|nr:glycoside hydrolase family 127 protein [Kiritimatiellota bacterium]